MKTSFLLPFYLYLRFIFLNLCNSLLFELMKKIACIVAGLFVALTMAAQTKVTWSMELGLGMSSWMGKDAGDSSPLFNQKVGVGIDVPLSGLV